MHIFLSIMLFLMPSMKYPKQVADSMERVIPEHLANEYYAQLVSAVYVHSEAMNRINGTKADEVAFVDSVQATLPHSPVAEAARALLLIHESDLMSDITIYSQPRYDATEDDNEPMDNWSSQRAYNEAQKCMRKALLEREMLKLVPSSRFSGCFNQTPDSVGLLLVPTMYDVIMQSFQFGKNLSTDEQAEWLAYHKADANILAYLYVQREIDQKTLYELLNETPDVEERGYLLSSLSTYMVEDCLNKGDRSYYQMLKQFVNKYPHSVWTPRCLTTLAIIEQQSVNLTYPDMLLTSSPIEVTAKLKNTRKLEIHLYRAYNRQWKQEARGFKDVATHEILIDKELPFDTTITFTFLPPGFGQYFIVSHIMDADAGTLLKDDDYVSTSNELCISNLSTLLVNSEKATRLLCVDAYTGKPASAKLNIYSYKYNDVPLLYRTVRTKKGWADVSLSATRYNYVVPAKGKDKWGKALTIWPFELSDGQSVNYQIYTDLGIYRPGETVHGVIVGMELNNKVGEKRMAAQRKITLIIYNAEHKKVLQQDLQTDDFGQAEWEFHVPTEGKNGRYSIQVDSKEKNTYGYGSAGIEVSEYKLPTFAVKLELPSSLSDEDSLVIEGLVRTFTGMPMSNLVVSGKLTPRQYWYCRGGMPDMPAQKFEATTDANGKFRYVCPKEWTSVDRRKYRYAYFTYAVEVSAVDSVGETQQSSGQVYARGARAISLTRTNYQASESTRLSFSATEPCSCSFVLSKDSMPVQEGTFVSAEPVLNLSSVPSGRYHLLIRDNDGKAEEISDSVAIYRLTDKSLPCKASLWLPNETPTLQDGQVDLLLGTSYDQYIYYVARSRDQLLSQGWLHYKPGFHHFQLEAPKGDDQFVEISLMACHNNRWTQRSVSLDMPKRDEMHLSVVSFRDSLRAGQPTHWIFRLTNQEGKPYEGRVVLDVSSAAVNQLRSTSWYVPEANIIERYVTNYKTPYYSQESTSYIRPTRGYSSYKTPSIKSLVSLLYNSYYATVEEMEEEVFVVGYGAVSKGAYAGSSTGQPGSNSAIRIRGVSSVAAPLASEVAGVMLADKAESVHTDITADMSQARDAFSLMGALTVRADINKVATWQPCLVADSLGYVEVDFTAPADNATWLVRALALSPSGKYDMLEKNVYSTRPLMVKSRLPRFLRTGDQTPLFATIENSSDKPQMAYVCLELLTGADSLLFSRWDTISLAPRGAQSCSLPVCIQMADTLHFRVRAVTPDGDGDGEQVALPALPASMLLTEGFPFYLHPGEEAFTGEVSFDTTSQEVSLRIWDAVGYCFDALRKINQDTEHFCTAPQAAHRLYALAVMNKLAEQYPDSVRANRQAAQECAKALKRFQRTDGGFSWLDESRIQSSVYVTEEVLAILGELCELGADHYSQSVLKDAVYYLDKQMLEREEYLIKHNTKFRYTSFCSYAYTRSLYPNVERSAEVDSLLARTCRDVEAEWGNFSLSELAFSALMFHHMGNHKEAKNIVEGLRQRATTTRDKGMTWAIRDNSWYTYRPVAVTAQLLRTFGIVDPRADEIESIRQGLLLDKRTCDWGNYSLAADAVHALLTTGADWVKNPNMRPRFGAYMRVYEAPIAEVVAYKTDELQVRKVVSCKEAGKAASLEKNQRVTITLSITTTKALDNVVLTDHRAACIEPVSSHSGYVWSWSSTNYYLDVKDAANVFYITHLPKGKHVITYDCYLTQSGSFAAGLADVECTYAPEYSVHTAGGSIEVK